MYDTTCEFANNLISILPKISSDALIGFAGSLISAVATIIAVAMTIKFESRRQKNNDILKAKPWMASKSDHITTKQELDKLTKENNIFLFKWNTH